MIDYEKIKFCAVWAVILVLCIAFWFTIFALGGKKSNLEKIDLKKIAIIESSGNPLAWNKRDDSRGLFQITPICLKEYNNFHPENEYSMDDLWNTSISTKIADWYLNIRIPQMLKYYDKPPSVENILISYNAGISYVAHDKPLPRITKAYLKKYSR